MPYWRFDPVRLLHEHEKHGPFIRFCEILFILYILFFTYKFVRDVKAQGQRVVSALTQDQLTRSQNWLF